MAVSIATKLPKGRTRAEFGQLYSAEEILLQHAAAGTTAEVGAERPSQRTDKNRVRAEFIRFLALGGDDNAPVHEKGVWLQYAWIEGVLDLEAVATKGSLVLANCTFDKRPVLRDAHVKGTVNFQGSEVPGVSGDRLTCDASVFFRQEVKETGEVGQEFKATKLVRLVGAKIGSNLECSGGKFQGENGKALIANRVEIGGDTFLDNEFEATGTVSLSGARIEGDLRFQKARFSGTGAAISLRRSRTKGALVIQGVEVATGGIVLAGAEVWRLEDDENSWPERVNLNGFVYDGLAGDAPTDARIRIRWLDRQARVDGGKDSEEHRSKRENEEAGMRGGKGTGSFPFRPQPWQQLQKVLREMGHYEAARGIGIEFEKRKRRNGLIGGTPGLPPEWWPKWRGVKRLWGFARRFYQFTAKKLHLGYGLLVDYGYRPLKLLIIAMFVWLACFGVFHEGKARGVFAPTSSAIYASKSKALLACSEPPNGRLHWERCAKLPAEYPRLNTLVYSLNVLLPVGNLGQESAWRPMTTTWLGWAIQALVWVETLFGWGTSLILIAVVSGMAKRDD